MDTYRALRLTAFTASSGAHPHGSCGLSARDDWDDITAVDLDAGVEMSHLVTVRVSDYIERCNDELSHAGWLSDEVAS